MLALIFAIPTAIFGEAKIANLPFVGSFLNTTLLSVSGTWNAFVVTFPYAGIAWDVFVYVIVPFEVIMLFLKVFLGSRVPQAVN